MSKDRGSADAWLLTAFAVVVVLLGGFVLWLAHKDEPKLRAECEARGGMLISTRDKLYTCVGRPPAAPAANN
jgi:hypothetical protein